MLLNNSGKKLFDQAYDEYLKISQIIEGIFEDALADPFQDPVSVTDTICSLDLYIQSILAKLGVSDGSLSDTERHFIVSLPDEFDEVCSRHKGYRRFINTLSPDTFRQDGEKYFHYNKVPLFLTAIQDYDPVLVERVLVSLEKIWNCFIAIDDVFREEESAAAEEAISFLRSHLPQQAGASAAEHPSAPEAVVSESTDVVEAALQELNKLIGLTEVKKEIISNINLLKVNKLRKEKGLPELQISRHLVFTGCPGTGKTTVARIIAQIYMGLGVVSKGQLVETDRSGLVAGYVGQTALKTAQVIKRAKGGILFIDEAYALSSSKDSSDFGREAIDTLVKGMEDYRDDLVVIVAGYDEEMKQFIDMNPGLRSRFHKYIRFPNYTAEEMLEIFRILCDKNQFLLSQGAEEKILAYFQSQQEDPTFGNARGVRNFFDHIVVNQATRILTITDPSDSVFRSILSADIPTL